MAAYRPLALLVVAPLLLAPAVARAEPGNAWSAVDAPTAGVPRVIGGVAHGCIAGAARLPDDGPGYQVIRLSRRRDFGHPDLIAFIARLGRQARAAGLAPFYVGDMAQPRGGPLPFGHASHQTGIDADIWFNLDPKPPLAPAARESVALPSMLRAGLRDIDRKRFGARQVTLLRLAAADPAVDRIFVNAAIKDALCRGVAGATKGGRGWLRRIRPWWGHDEHFHVRLKCPAASPECEAQAPLPPGDGCDTTLAWWRAQKPPVRAAIAPRRAAPILPAACAAVLRAP
ncbi:MAG TPA: penicillin-insensitive murein endopeptidase [Stellaceae bacterium]